MSRITHRLTHRAMPRQLPVVLVLTTFLVGCGGHSDDASENASVHISTTHAESAPLKDGDVRIDVQSGGVDLALIGDTISSGLSQTTIATAARETDSSTVKGTGFGASIEKMVKSSVQKGLGTRVGFPISDIKSAAYRDGKISFDFVDGHKKVFDQAKINNKPLLESFSPADAQRFVDAVNARKGTVAR